jgi:excisionase family DNA binding protein
MTDRELVSIEEACEIAGVSRRSIHNWLNSGKIEAVRTAGGNVRIYKDSLFHEFVPTKKPSQFRVTEKP